MTQGHVQGSVDPRFAAVADVFANCLREAELGAAFCAYAGGEKVVDLWGGWADADRTQEWQEDTLACVFSAAKGMTATCAHLLVDRGLLDVDEPVARYWPEFGQAGKEAITLRMVLSHQAGLPYTTSRSPRGKRFDWDTASSALAGQAPVWEPGTRVEYHGGTFGYLVGNVVQRITGQSLSEFFHDQVASPLGADFRVSVSLEDDHRCAEMVGPKSTVGPCRTRQWRAAGDGSATAYSTAAGLARVYAGLASDGSGAVDPLVGAAAVDAAIEEQDLLYAPGLADEYGLGYQLFWRLFPGMNDQTFGHTGMGGCVGLADRKRGLAMAFVANKLGGGSAVPLVNTTYAIAVPNPSSPG